MRKKLKKIMKEIKNNKLDIGKNKRFFGIFASIFSILIIISATLAWSSYSEWVDNHVQSDAETVTVKIIEKFKQNSVLSFSDGIEKSVKVRNMSDRNAIIRVKFSESFLPFQMDMSDGENQGNGGLKVVKRINNEELIDIDNIETWKTGSLLSMDDKNNGYYIASSPLIVKEPYKGEEYRSDSSRPKELSYFKWTFNPSLFNSPQTNKVTPFWVFDGQYFYYSKVLEGGETTYIDLLQSVQLVDSIDIPNKYKSALYDIHIEAEGVESSEKGVESWNLGSNFLDMYKEDARFK
ncbi:hypothetical protein JNUCC83_08820 [Vagococcus sp. JNUCC 83]